MDNSILPVTALETMETGTRTRGSPKKRWIENIKEDIQKRGSNLHHGVECISKTGISGRRSSVQPDRRQPTGEDGRAKKERNYSLQGTYIAVFSFNGLKLNE